ncbi:MAG: cobalamin-independent methionine synthase II family protein [Betaproteobacteria bacterium]|nr:cobalamin-independent methionine synthase II family protein [Betaproteobacteria bacterium]
MTLKARSERILTTHVGSLPRPKELLDLMKAALSAEPYDRDAYANRIRSAVAEIVRRQADAGIDIVTDGEMSKPGYFTYVRERLSGFEPRPGMKRTQFAAVVPIVPIACTGPVSYQGTEALARDIKNLKAALAGVKHEAVFMPAISPAGVGVNEYYGSEEDFYTAVSEALRTEYLAIVEAGFLVQIDDPSLSYIFTDPTLDAAQRRRRADLYVEAINHSLRSVPPEKVRYHTCYGINEGPRIHEAGLKDVVEHMLRVNAGAYSFEAANCRHEHEYHLWESVKLPEGKTIMPGVITHATNIVEHPELVAERIVRFAQRVGRENIIAGVDCGFSSQAMYHPEVHPTVVWAKFQALAEGARLATKQLWH